MPSLYNRIANQSLDRLSALSDGVFAFAMTLLVLDLRLPEQTAIHSEHDLWRALAALAPSLLIYVMGFLTLGIFWNGQQTQLNYIARGDRDLAWIHLAFLFTITLMPFSTRLLADFVHYRAAVLVYWLNVLAPGALLYASWKYVSRHDMIQSDTPPEVRAAICTRVFIAQSLYAVGAALSVFGSLWSVAFIFAVQLNYAIAPRLPKRRSAVPAP
ncbi:MAG TPA: TMEM175 family protein [Acidobacteriaceae bacterium]|nr:TMEM175 family protein [Acidobacteriaceae bacterium]